MMNYYERHMGDYAKDAAHLSLLEHGIYCRLLDVYYIHEAPIPNSQVARLIGARSPEEIAGLSAVLDEFFVLDSDQRWRQERCEKEIARYKEKSAKASASATKRWSDRRPNAVRTHSERTSHPDLSTENDPKAMRTHSEGNANGMLPKPQTPITINTPLPPLEGGGLSAEAFENPELPFDRFWSAYPDTPRKAAREQCAKKWRQMDCDGKAQTIIDGLKAWKSSEEWMKSSGDFIPAPLNWLKASFWTTIPTPSGSSSPIPGYEETRARNETEGARQIAKPPADLIARLAKRREALAGDEPSTA